MPLSQNWTLGSFQGALRVLADAIAIGKITTEFLNDITYFAICDVAELLNIGAYPDYADSQVVTANSDVIDLSSYSIDNVIKLVDSGKGLVGKADPDEIENVANIEQYKNSIFYCQLGQKIYLKKGSGVTAYGTLTLHYNRIPTKATQPTDKLDIKDKYALLALNKAKILLYETTEKTPPEALTSTVNANIQAIRQGNIDEMMAMKSKGNK